MNAALSIFLLFFSAFIRVHPRFSPYSSVFIRG